MLYKNIVGVHDKIHVLISLRAICYMMYGIMTKELVIRQIRINKAAGRGDSDSRMISFEVIMPLKLQSTKILIIEFETYNLCCNNQYLCIMRTVLL